MNSNGAVMNEWKLREQMCEIGRRVYNKGFAAANDGNISYRLGEDRVLCTPTRVSKGFMKPDDLCIVDLDGKQVSGKRKRSSEILLHLTVMKARADVRSVRPLPPAPRHGVRRRPRADPQVRPARDRGLPRRGRDLPLRDARRPGVRRHGAPLRQGHRHDPAGQPRDLTYGSDLEDAYFKTEIIDAYCRILILARQIGRVNYYSDEKAAELIRLKPKLGHPRPPAGARPRELRPLRQQPVPRGLRRVPARAPRLHPSQDRRQRAPQVADRGRPDAASPAHPAGSRLGTPSSAQRRQAIEQRPRVRRRSRLRGARPGDHRPGHAGPERSASGRATVPGRSVGHSQLARRGDESMKVSIIGGGGLVGSSRGLRAPVRRDGQPDRPDRPERRPGQGAGPRPAPRRLARGRPADPRHRLRGDPRERPRRASPPASGASPTRAGST